MVKVKLIKYIFLLSIIILLGCQNSQQFGQSTAELEAPSGPSSPSTGPSSSSEDLLNREATVTPPPNQENPNSENPPSSPPSPSSPSPTPSPPSNPTPNSPPPASLNTSPIITSNCLSTAIQNSSYVCQLMATDANPTDKLIFSIDSSENTCAWVGFDPIYNQISGTPLAIDVGTCILAYQVNDGSMAVKRKSNIVVSALSFATPTEIDFEVITVHNTSGAASPVYVRTTGLFAKGQFPSQRYLQVTRLGSGREAVPAQMDEVVHWSDGSIKFGVISFYDIDLPPSGSRKYVIQSSERQPSSIPVYSLSDVTEDVKMRFTNVKRRTAEATPVVTNENDLLASLQSAKNHTTRVTQIAAGPVVSGWQIWQMAKNNNTEHDHLKVYWYIWKWANQKTEVTAITSLDWWEYGGENGKQHMDYSAALLNGENLIHNYGDVHHHYHAQWAAVRMNDDAQHGQPHWLSQTPTLFVERDRFYLVKTGLIPPFNPQIVPSNRTYSTNYSLFRSMDHTRGSYDVTDAFGNPMQDIDMTGGWYGKGIWPEMEVYAFLKQTPNEARVARVHAFAGLNIPRHFRTRALRHRPQDSTSDISSSPLTWKLDGYKKEANGTWQAVAPSEYDFTSDGMPAPKHYYRFAGGETGYSYLPIVGMPSNGQSGNSGPITFRYPGSSHGVNYTLPQYLLTGYRYLLESSIDTALGAAASWYGDCYGIRPRSKWSTCSGSEQWAGVAEVNGQERGVGWSNNIISATAFVPDKDVMSAYLKKWNAHTANYFLKFIEDANTKAPLWNGAVMATGAGSAGIWQNSYVILGSLYNYSVSEVAGYKALAESSIRFLNNYAQYPAQLMWYYVRSSIDDGTKINFLNEPFLSQSATFNADNTVTLEAPTLGYPYSNNDEIFISSGAGTVPAELSRVTKYYLVNVSGVTAQLANEPGGSPISFSPSTNVTVGVKIQSYKLITYAGQNSSYVPYAGHYIYEALSALEYGKFVGASTINNTYLNNVRVFLQNSSNYAANMASYPLVSLTENVMSLEHVHPPTLTTPPVFTSSCPPTALQDTPYGCLLSASDVEHEPLTFSIDTQIHSCGWMSLSGNQLSGTPNDDQVGSCFIGIKVSDGGNTVKQQILVSIANKKPILSLPSEPIVVSGLIGSLIVLSEDKAISNEKNFGVFSLAIGGNNGGATKPCSGYGTVQIDPQTGQVTFTPDADPAHAGECVIDIVFSDGNPDGETQKSIALNINKTYSQGLLTISKPQPVFSTTLVYHQTQDVTYTLTNVAPGPISGISVGSFLTNHFAVMSPPCGTLLGGADCTVVVRFTSEALLTYSDRLVINYTNDSGLQSISKDIAFAGIDTLAPNPPQSISLANSVTGNLSRPTLRVQGVVAGDTIRLFKDACVNEIGVGVASGNFIDLTVNENSFAANQSYSIYANATDSWNNTSTCSPTSLNYTTPNLFTFDTALGGDGGVSRAVEQYNRSYKILEQSDGKLVLFGVNQSQIAILRFNSNGTIDTGFDTDGMQTLSVCTQKNFVDDALLSGTFSGRVGALVQSDGKIVFIGACYNYGNNATTDTVVLRLKSDGSYDTSFNGTGYIRIDLSGASREDFGAAIGLTSDNKYIIGGTFKNDSGNYDMYVTRLNSNGSLDSSYANGSSPIIRMDFGEGNDVIRDLKIQSNNQVIVGGRAFVHSKDQILLMKLTSAGILEPSFADHGILITDLGQNYDFRAEDLLMQSDQKILVAGNTNNNKVAFVARFQSDGSPDTAFSGDGLALAGESADSFSTVSSLVLHSSGEMILTALSTSNSTKIFRMHSNGSFDPLISSDGVNGDKGKSVISNSLFSPNNPLTPFDSLLDFEGKLVIGGTVSKSGASDHGLFRVNLDYIRP